MNILDTDIDRLKQDQLKALEQQVETVLTDVIKLFKAGEYRELELKYLVYSPAGDDMGCENHFINFSWKDSELDIGDVLAMARKLTNNRE